MPKNKLIIRIQEEFFTVELSLTLKSNNKITYRAHFLKTGFQAKSKALPLQLLHNGDEILNSFLYTCIRQTAAKLCTYATHMR